MDAQYLNTIRPANERPERIEELLQKYEGVRFMLTTDLVSGYWQVPLENQSRQYTAFLFNGMLYQFRVIPFGIKTAGSGFIRALSMALGPELLEV